MSCEIDMDCGKSPVAFKERHRTHDAAARETLFD